MRPDGTFLTRLFSSLQAAVTAAPNGTSRAPTIIDVRGVCVGITLLEERSNLLIQGEMPAACPPGTSLRSTLKGDPSADPPDGSKGEVVKVIDSQNIVVRYLNIVDGGEHDGLEFKETLRSTGDCNCVARNDEGYELDGGSSHVIRDSLVTDNVNGIRLHAGAVDNLVIGNISEFNAEHGIVLLDSDVEQNTVLDNTVRANGADCIHLDEADFNDVVENTVGGGISSPQLDCGGTDIRLVNDADFNFINGNVDPNGRLVPVQCTGSTLDGNTGNNCLAR
jgi:parallel beta-helix repeat protein